jgi:hypothetical protein
VVEEVVVVDEVVVVEVVVLDELVLGREVDGVDAVVGGLVGVFVAVVVVGSAGVVGVGRVGPVLVVLEDMLRVVNTSLARCLPAAMLAVLRGAIDRDGTMRTATGTSEGLVIPLPIPLETSSRR